MNPLIKYQDVTLETLTIALDNAVVDYQPIDESTVYVTGNAFPVFVKVDTERQFVIMSTFLDVVPGIDSSSACEFVNRLNNELLVAQFGYQAESHRLYGHYVLSYRDGFNSRQVIRSIRTFASVFDGAADDGMDQKILLPLDCCAGEDAQGPTRH